MRLVNRQAAGLVASFTALLAQAQGPADSGTVSPPIVLPAIRVVSERLDPKLLLPREALTPPDFKGVPSETVYPSRARHDGVFEGRAVVGVMLDRVGRVTDALFLKYSKRYFADELLAVVRHETFTPRLVRGAAVSGRYALGHHFRRTGEVAMTPMDAMAELTHRVTYTLEGGPPYEFEPCNESATDGATLRFTQAAAPVTPAAFQLAPGTRKRVVISFYVDEAGMVRLPNVESDTEPELIEAVLAAVTTWRCAPPTRERKPALVFAIRVLEFGAPKSGDATLTPAHEANE